MRVDVHTHVFPTDVARDRQAYFQNEPAFKLLYGSPGAKIATAEDLLEAMEKNRVDRSVVFGFPWRDHDLARRHNDYVLEAASRYSRSLVPLGCVDPLAQFAEGEAERCLFAGAKGIGEIAVYSECDVQAALRSFQEIVELCKAHRAVLLVHANEPVGHVYPGKAPQGLDFYYAIARMCSGSPMILAHWGGGLCFYELLKKEAREVLADVYYDTAASPYLYRSDIYAQAARAAGKEKILFGSDFPLLPPSRYFAEMAEAGLTREEIESISGGNAARLFGLDV